MLPQEDKNQQTARKTLYAKYIPAVDYTPPPYGTKGGGDTIPKKDGERWGNFVIMQLGQNGQNPEPSILLTLQTE